jgi:hypothetical protein
MSDHPRPDDEPTLGRIVMYRPTTGLRLLPAVIVTVPDTLGPVENVRAPDAGHLHIVVLSPLVGAAAFQNIGEDDHRGGFYVEDTQAHGTWRWPDFAAGRRARV